MGIIAIILLVGIACVGLAGILVRNGVVRAMLWMLAIPPGLFGVQAIVQGGIAEPFTPGMLTAFTVVAFWPLVGCGIGQVVHMARRSQLSDGRHQDTEGR